MQVATALPHFTVITAVPFFFAVILPLESTVAMLLFELLYEMVSLLAAGTLVGFKVYVFFTFREYVFGTFFRLVVFIPCTFTVQINFFDPAFTVIFAVPANAARETFMNRILE